VIDVGGQKNERKKWRTAFDDITAVVFLVAVSEFDTDMRERKVPKNRMVDALECFEETLAEWPDSESPDIILFLNKSDQLQEKLSSGKDIRMCEALNDYQGSQSLEEVCDFIGKKFVERIPKEKKREVYVKPTTATDCQMMSDVLKVVTTAAMRKTMRAAYDEW